MTAVGSERPFIIFLQLLVYHSSIKYSLRKKTCYSLFRLRYTVALTGINYQGSLPLVQKKENGRKGLCLEMNRSLLPPFVIFQFKHRCLSLKNCLIPEVFRLLYKLGLYDGMKASRLNNTHIQDMISPD